MFAFSHCLLQHFQANSHLIFPTESPNTLPIHAPEKMRPERSSGESFKVVQRSLLQKQILFSALNADISDKKHVKSSWHDWIFSCRIIFSLIKCVFLTSLPTTTYSPNSWLYYIKENWERVGMGQNTSLNRDTYL